MRHRLAHRKLNRDSAGRKALLRGLATQLVEHGTLVTTVERAKELRKVVEPLVALARVDSVTNRRSAAATLYSKKSVGDLFTKVAPANAERKGGYTRILKLGFRPGDNARRALIEFVEPKAIKAEVEAVNA
ncbi:50S ribosomal protein L17 [Fluviispira sanaruensis]|uniref:Large ribosomal subunit protein bL17 n=1 Tax=Fluviispira sanaruensis TaxID=2493639 RepID=A0A4P2VKP5_FLUSA|nr:50S ribosomal protein L17 [Fluviispira sanaruensis]BBH53883.1 50S ribosomal protein L17 [Fluviispira sanaruensis]